MVAGFGPLFKTDTVDMFWCHRMMAWWQVLGDYEKQISQIQVIL